MFHINTSYRAKVTRQHSRLSHHPQWCFQTAHIQHTTCSPTRRRNLQHLQSKQHAQASLQHDKTSLTNASTKSITIANASKHPSPLPFNTQSVPSHQSQNRHSTPIIRPTNLNALDCIYQYSLHATHLAQQQQQKQQQQQHQQPHLTDQTPKQTHSSRLLPPRSRRPRLRPNPKPAL